MNGRLVIKKLIIPNLPYLIFFLLFTKVSEAYRLAPGSAFGEKLLAISRGFDYVSGVLPATVTDALFGIVCAMLVRLLVYVKGRNAKKYRKDVEYGSARWGSADDIRPFMDKESENNMILTKTEGLMMSGRPKNPKHARNKNVLVVGGSGSGKTRFFLKPNLMQMHSSYVVTDPKGSVLTECGRLLLRGGYRIRVLNTINFGKSMHYNPFVYIHSEKDVLKLVTVLIANTKGEGKSGDDFWVKAETLLYTALIGYIYYEAPESEQNFNTLVEMIDAMEVREDDETFKNAVDMLFDALEKKSPGHFALRQYRKFKLAAGDIRSKGRFDIALKWQEINHSRHGWIDKTGEIGVMPLHLEILVKQLPRKESIHAGRKTRAALARAA
jgi:type IV secretion system protein VirD4